MASTSYTGLRFTGVTIPPGAIVSSARLELRSPSAQWLTIGFQYRRRGVGQQRGVSAASRPSQRPLLAATLVHTSNEQWLANTSYQLDQIAPLVQAVINQPGWTSGNALTVVMRGSGDAWARKYAAAFEGGAALAPRLVVTYSAAQGDPAPSLSIGDVTVTEGQSGSTNATFSVGLSAASPQVITAIWATANGTATAGSDYTAGSGTVTFPANSTAAQTVTVQVTGDSVVEPSETFVVNLTSPTIAAIADGQGIGTITNDDAGSTLSIGNVALAEGTGGTTAFNFTVTLSPASTAPVTVAFATVDARRRRAATAPPTSGTLTFNPGVTTQTATVSRDGRRLTEANEQFTVQLSAPTDATITGGSGQGPSTTTTCRRCRRSSAT